jgi:hypothetical protein
LSRNAGAPSTGGKSRLGCRRQSVNAVLNNLTKAVGVELLEDGPDFPFAGGNPLPVRGFIHGPQSLIEGLLATLSQLPLEDFLVHTRPPEVKTNSHHNALFGNPHLQADKPSS